jgi:hypothetical protein
MSTDEQVVWEKIVDAGFPAMQAHLEVAHMRAGTVSARTCPALTALGIFNNPEAAAPQPDARETLPPQVDSRFVEDCKEQGILPPEFVPLLNDVLKDSNPKDAVGSKKAPLSVLPFPPLYEVAAGMLEGACKYRRHNYRAIGVRASVYFDAAMRHLTAWWEGEDIDPVSGIHHVSKAIAGLLVARDSMLQGNFHDDRPPAANAEWQQRTQDLIDAVLERYPNPLPPYVREESK